MVKLIKVNNQQQNQQRNLNNNVQVRLSMYHRHASPAVMI